MVVSGMGVWLSLQNSAVLRLVHSVTYEILAEVNTAPAVTKMLSSKYLYNIMCVTPFPDSVKSCGYIVPRPSYGGKIILYVGWRRTSIFVEKIYLVFFNRLFFAGCDDIIRQHKAACLRVTSLLAVKDLLWIGTSAGVVLTMTIPAVVANTTKLVTLPVPIG